jgi:hypothetical protein
MVSVTKDISELLPRSGMHESCACSLSGQAKSRDHLSQLRAFAFGLRHDGDVTVVVC